MIYTFSGAAFKLDYSSVDVRQVRRWNDQPKRLVVELNGREETGFLALSKRINRNTYSNNSLVVASFQGVFLCDTVRDEISYKK